MRTHEPRSYEGVRPVAFFSASLLTTYNALSRSNNLQHYKSLLHRKPLPIHVQASKALELLQPPPPSLRAQCCQSQARPLPPLRSAPAPPGIRARRLSQLRLDADSGNWWLFCRTCWRGRKTRRLLTATPVLGPHQTTVPAAPAAARRSIAGWG